MAIREQRAQLKNSCATIEEHRKRNSSLRYPAAHLVWAMCSKAWYTRVCRYSTFLLYTQADPWMTSAATGVQGDGRC